VETTKGRWILLAAALSVAWPLLLPWTYDTHDGQYALYNAAQLDHALRAGEFPVRWIPDVFGGRGVPLFLYYHPLAFYLVAALHVTGLGYIAAMKALELVAVTAAGFSMRAFLRAHVSADAALVGAIAYVAAPIHVVELHVKGDPPALLAYALAPLVFLAIRRAARGERFGVGGLGAACAALALSHSVTALILLPAAALYAALAEKGVRPLFRVAAGCLLGAAVASFHVVPAMSERGLVYIDSPLGILAFDWRDHFVAWWQWLSPLWGYHGSFAGTKDDMSFQIGPAHVAGIVLGCVALRRAREREALRFGTWAAVTVALAAFMTLSMSRGVWEIAGTLRYVQFPWRFLMPLALGACALVAIAVDAIPSRRVVVACAIVPPVLTGVFAAITGNRFYLVVLVFQIALGAVCWALRSRAALSLCLLFIGLVLPWSAVPLHARFKHEPAVIPLHEEDLRPERVRLGVRRTTARDDYLPRSVGEATIPPRDVTQEYLPPPGAVAPEDVIVRAGRVEVSDVDRGGRGLSFVADAPEGGIVALNLHDFPGWTVRLYSGEGRFRGELVPGTDDAGRMVLSLPPGRFEVRAAFGETPERRFWDRVSLVGLFVLAALTFLAWGWRR
jgi:hypothetical protein